MAIRVVHVGLGPIGAGIVRQVAARKGLTIVGAVDIDPEKIGRDLGDVAGAGRRLRVKVQSDLARTLKATAPDVVVLCTSSALRAVRPQINTILKAKVPIVSTTEELAYRGTARRDWRQSSMRWPGERRWRCSVRASTRDSSWTRSPSR